GALFRVGLPPDHPVSDRRPFQDAVAARGTLITVDAARLPPRPGRPAISIDRWMRIAKEVRPLPARDLGRMYVLRAHMRAGPTANTGERCPSGRDDVSPTGARLHMR
ncbi:MAG: hypothetical protein WA761_00555, partial [Thermoplasmata archaeon]